MRILKDSYESMGHEHKKLLVLGSAMWGWSVDKETAFSMLDTFVLEGGVYIDTATNYPINANPDEFGTAVKWLHEWLHVNGFNSVKIILKIGAVDNSGSNKSCLSEDYVKFAYEHYCDKLKQALHNISIHWDNRGEKADDYKNINDMLRAFRYISKTQTSIGLSGVRYPKVFSDIAPDLRDLWWIQVKENLISCAARQHYEVYFPNSKYLAYGINLGGVRDSQDLGVSASLRGLSYSNDVISRIMHEAQSAGRYFHDLKNIYNFTLYNAYINNKLTGVIVGPRSLMQMESILSMWNKFKDYENVR